MSFDKQFCLGNVLITHSGGNFLQEIAKIAHEYGALLVVDNSIMSPVLSKPLDLGAGKVYIKLT